MTSRFLSLRSSSVVFKRGRKYAVVISKKVAKLAVTRNLIRRRLFSILRSMSLEKPLIIIVKKGADGLSFADLKKELQGLFSK